MHWRPTSLAADGARPHTLPSRRGLSRRPAPRRLLAAAAVTIALAAIPVFAGATTGASAASGGTTVSVAPGPFGSMLVVGSGMFAGYALYYITGDTPPNYSCTTTVIKLRGNALSCTGLPGSQKAEWPALITKGAPVAGPGVSKTLLGTVQRPGLGSQVTYAGHPLYLFDNSPGQVSGVGWFEPSLPPFHGLWYLISAQGTPLPWTGTLTTTTVAGKTVLGTAMIDGGGWHVFPLYSYSSDSSSKAACTGACAVAWPPLLTQGTAGVAKPLAASAVGTLKGSDGTQVTYHGKPLYLFAFEGIAPNQNGPGFHVTGNGNGVKVGGGSFQLITP
jgi:predicted lipoprotein with Yx(FWY)xxD motif